MLLCLYEMFLCLHVSKSVSACLCLCPQFSVSTCFCAYLYLNATVSTSFMFLYVSVFVYFCDCMIPQINSNFILNKYKREYLFCLQYSIQEYKDIVKWADIIVINNI